MLCLFLMAMTNFRPRHHTFSFFSKSNAQSIGHKLSNTWSKEGSSFQEEYRFLWEWGQQLRSRLILVYAGRIRPPSQHGQSTGILSISLSPEEIVEPLCFIWDKNRQISPQSIPMKICILEATFLWNISICILNKCIS